MSTNSNALKIGCINTRNSNSPRRLVTLARKLKYDLIILTDVNFRHQHSIKNSFSVHHDEHFSTTIVVINTAFKIKSNYVDKHIVYITLVDIRLNLVAYYLRPNDSSEVIDTGNKLTELIRTVKGDTIFLGDLNAHHSCLGDSTDARGGSYLSIIQSMGYTIINDPSEYTYLDYHGSSSPDWTFCTNNIASKAVWSIDTDFDGYSDHRLISVVITLNLPSSTTQRVIATNPNKFIKKIMAYTSIHDLPNWHEHLTKALTDSQVEITSSATVDFWSDQLKEEKKEITSLLRHQRSIKFTGTFEQLSELSAKIKQLSIKHKKNVDRAKEEFYLNQLRQADHSDVFTKIIAPLKTRKRHNVDHLVINRERIYDSETIAEQVIDHFYVSQDEPSDTFNDIDTNNVDDHAITDREVHTAVNELKLRKAPGENRLGSELIKTWYSADSDYINHLLRYWYETGIFPSQFKSSMVIPIVKKPGAPLTINNLRPIGLLCHLGKLYERVLKNRLVHLAFTKNFFGDEQCGYLPHRSAVDALHRIQSKRSKNASLIKTPAEIIASFDIKSAFDSLRHRSIIQSLAQLGVSNNMLAVMKDYFTGRTAKLTIGDYTAVRNMSRGIVQGGCVSPFLWSLTFESVIKKLREKIYSLGVLVTISVYADDVTLVITSSDDIMKALQTLHILVNELVVAAEQIGLNIAINKTQLMMTNKNKVNMKVRLLDVDLPFLDHLKVLGVYFSRTNKFTYHLEQRMNVSKEKFALFASTLRRKEGLKHRIKEQIITAIIYPTISYASEIWFNKNEHWISLRNYFRHLMIRSSRCFRTISHMSVLMLARIPPLHYYIEFVSQYQRKLRKGSRPGNLKYERYPSITALPPPYARQIIPISGYIREQDTVPQDTEINIFTDGSKIQEATTSVGAAYVIYNGSAELSHQKFKLASLASVYTAELVALREAIKYVHTSTHTSASLFSDSRSAILATLGDQSSNNLAAETHNLMVDVRGRKTVNMYWIKAHVGHVGNERADVLANEARSDGTLVHTLVPSSHLKQKLRYNMRTRINTEYQTSEWGRTMKQFAPEYMCSQRKYMVINDYTVLIYTGHLPTASYLFERKKVTSPNCPCGAVQDVKHVVTYCPIFAEQNFQVALTAGLNAQQFLGSWDELIVMKKFHKYIYLRAKTLVAQLHDMNTIDTHNHDTNTVSTSADSNTDNSLVTHNTNMNIADIVEHDEEYENMMARVSIEEANPASVKRSRHIQLMPIARDTSPETTHNKRHKDNHVTHTDGS